MNIKIFLIIAMLSLGGCTFIQTKDVTYASILKDVEAKKIIDPNGVETIEVSGKQAPSAIDAFLAGVATVLIIGL